MESIWELAGLLAGCLLGVGSVLTRHALRFESVIKAVWFIGVSGAIILIPWAIPPLRVYVGGSDGLSGVVFFLAAGITGPVIGRIFLFQTMTLLGPSVGTAFKTAVPFLTAISARILFHETLGWMGSTGVVMVVLGLFVLVWFQPESDASVAAGKAVEKTGDAARPTSVALAESAAGRESGDDRRASVWWSAGAAVGVASAIAYSVTDLFRRGGMDAFPSPVVGAWVGNVAAVAVLTGYFLAAGRGRELVRWDSRAVPALAGAGVLITLAYIVFLTGVSRSGVSVTSALASIEPIAVLIVGKLFLRSGEPIQMRQVPGLVVVVIGVMLIVLRTT